MKRPTEFIPIYDQTKEQAYDMVEKMFDQIELLEKKLYDQALENVELQHRAAKKRCLLESTLAESLEQIKLFGMSAEREDKLRAELATANGLLDEVSGLIKGRKCTCDDQDRFGGFCQMCDCLGPEIIELMAKREVDHD